MKPDLMIIGGGLAGCEAAWQAACRGLNVALYEMRPQRYTGAHRGDQLAELVCSNSLGSRLEDRAAGQLMWEVRRMGSLLLDCAEKTALPAGGALAVDREAFAEMVTQRIQSHPGITLLREEMTEIPDRPVVIASGPLTSPDLSTAIARLTGESHLYFYDAVAPVLTYESIDMGTAFWGSRYGRGETEQGDYVNCPLDARQYEDFRQALVSAERIALLEFENDIEEGVDAGPGQYFEGCLPVEIIARRGQAALAFGPLRPVGLVDPRTGRRPHAVVQLRRDNIAGSLFNLVGFQTNLKFPEQRRVFRMIPGLENADFARYGQMHRNTFIYSPALLDPTLQMRSSERIYFAGQITGIEGYMGNIASGLLAGWNASRWIQGKPPVVLPQTTMIGALCRYITQASPRDFQPMKANFGILPALDGEKIRDKKSRLMTYVSRARQDLEETLRLTA